MSENTKEFILTTLSQMKNEKALFESDMKEASAYMRHRTKELNSKVDRVPIYNSTPIDAVNTCANGIAGYLISPSIRWFRFRVKNYRQQDEMSGVSDWLEDAESQMYSLYSNSKFYSTSLEALKDAIITGTSYEMITDRMANGKIVFENYNPYECYIAEDENGDVDTFFREYTLTARQAYKRFKENLPEEVKQMVELNPNASCQFIHAVYPRKNFKEGIAVAEYKRFASVHYSKVGDKVFYESGYDDFPLAVHRWRKSGSSPYGIGLVMDYISEVKRLNDLTKQYSIAVQFQASPMLQAPESMKNKFIYRPGSINFANPNQGTVTAINTQLNINYLGAQIQDLEAKLNRLFYADLFNILMRQERQRTAYEVQELKGEGLILLSAIIGNMQTEKLNPLVLRTFRILNANEQFYEEAPELLREASANGMVDIELDGPLAQTMKQFHQSTGLEQGLAGIASVVQLFPDSIVNFSGDKIARQYATSKGLPQNCILEVSEVEQIHKQQAQAQAQAQQQAQAVQQSEMLKNLGYDIGNASALNQAGALEGAYAQS